MTERLGIPQGNKRYLLDKSNNLEEGDEAVTTTGIQITDESALLDQSWVGGDS